MSVFERPKGSGRWVSKFVLRGEQKWTPGAPWATKRQGEEAERRYRDLLEHRRSEETCASFADRWLEEWPRPAASTRRHYGIAAKRFKDEFGPTPLGEVERISARAWALGVPRNVSKTISTMFQDAYNVGLVDANPFANLRLPATEKTAEVSPPTLEEFRALLDACSVLGGYGAEFRALIQFTAWTGLRAAEVQGIHWTDIGTDTLWVRRARKDDGAYGKPKNGHEREIVFLTAARVLDQVPRRHKSPFVFHSLKGQPLNKGNLYYAWKTVRDNSGTTPDRVAADIRPVRFHDLRHFCATQLLEQGNSHYDVSVQLGHEDGGALVMARYGHPSKDAARERLLLRDPGRSSEIGSSVTTEVAGK